MITAMAAAMLLSAVLLPAMRCAAADFRLTPCTAAVRTGGDSPVQTVNAIQCEYKNNDYISVADMAAVLKDTEKAFTFGQYNGYWYIITGQPCSWEISSPLYFDYTGSESEQCIYVDGTLKIYSGIALGSGLYLPLTALEMILDISADYSDGVYTLNTDVPFSADPEKLENEGYFDRFNGVLLGNADTGEIYYSFKQDNAVPIASTSKLLTTWIVCSAISSGTISLDDRITISKDIEEASKANYAVLGFREGAQISVSDLLKAMLIESSNEAAKVLAETLSGSEDGFAGMMTAAARSMFMFDTRCYNSNGSPSFLADGITVERENISTAGDIFILASRLVTDYPWITEITSQKTEYLETIGAQVNNTNCLLYNTEGTTGLKTGTTWNAGYCLTVSREVEIDGETNTVIAIVLGADNESDRSEAAELLLRSGLY